MRKKVIKVISVCLAISMMAGSLWGCSAPAGTEGSRDTKEQQKESGTQAKNVPKGRYVENSIPIPLEEGERAADIVRTPEGSLELYTVKDKEGARYIWSGERWEKQDTSLVEGIQFPYETMHMIYGEDGCRYVVYQGGDDYKTCLMKLEEGKEPISLLDEVFSAKNQSDYYDVRADFVAVTAEGNIVLSAQRETGVYSQEGELLFSVPQEWSSMEWKSSGLLTGDRYITIGSSSYLCYDLSRSSASPSGEIPYYPGDYSMYDPMVYDGSDGFYTVNAQGIHHINMGGTIWETVVDGTLNSLSLPSAYAKKLFMGSENDFYAWVAQSNESGGEEIKHYTYDPEMPSVPSETLTVYGLDLGTTDTIRQAASMFQLNHPDVKVELIDGQASGGSTTVSDTIRTLNTELLSGNGADLLVLDGLPVDSYIEKGVLEDMKDLLAPMISSGELLEQIGKPYTEENGSIYQIPTRMNLLTAYGDQKAIDSLASLEAMRTYQSDPANPPLRSRTVYENLLRQILTLRYEEVIDRETGKPYEGKIQELLETVKILGEACGAEASFDESVDGGRGYVYNMRPGTYGLLDSEYDRVDQGQSAIAIDQIDGMYGTILPLAVQRKNGWTMENVNNSYLPSGTIGINQASPRKDLAREFVLFVLGQQVQSSDLSDGLPVNAGAAKNWVEKENTNGASIAVSGGDGYEIEGAWPEQEERRMIFDVAARADHPVRTDRVLMEIIINETQGFFEGSLSLEQAAQNAQNKAELYFSE